MSVPLDPTAGASGASGVDPVTSSALSGKEAKAALKAAKAARRAAEKDAKGVVPESAPRPQSSVARPTDSQSGPLNVRDEATRPAGQQQQQLHQQQQFRPRGQSQSQAQRPAPLRRKVSNEKVAGSSRDKKEVSLFKHLYTSGSKTVSGDVHPAVLALGQQMATYTICGSSARCVAMLLAFKQAIKSYTTPPGMALNRHMPSHFLGRQIEYLISQRPMSISMGNAIRWLKEAIGKLSIDLPESTAKAHICDSIDDFIQERITAADSLIASSAAAKIKPGMTIVTYAKSHVVTRTLLHAHGDLGLRFKVLVLDSRPLFEGRKLASTLTAAGVETSYALINAAPHGVARADLCLLGAHAMMANGRLCSRVGTASVALAAHEADVPVIALCESVKFSGRVALDSIVMNELAEPDELVPASVPSASAADWGRQEGEEAVVDGQAVGGLQDWRAVPGLQLLNLMHDYTPAAYVDMVITEYGSLPPTSVPVVYSISTGEHQQGR